MPDSVTIALIAAASSLITAILSVSVNAWIGSRRAANDDVQLGMNALREGLSSAVKTTDKLTIKLNTLEARATLVLSENNRFRIIHGERPAISLDNFDPIPDERFQQIMEQLNGRGRDLREHG